MMTTIDPSISSGIAAALELAINTALKYDPASRQKVSAMTDILAMRCTMPALALYCRGTDEGVRISAHCAAPITTQLTGSPLALLSLIKQPTTLANSGVDLEGKISLLQQWQAVLQTLDIDWEAALHEVLGDFSPYAGHHVAQGIKKSASYFMAQQAETRRLAKEYIEEELRLVPTQPELDYFYEQVGEVTMGVDRIEARLANIRSKLVAISTSKTAEKNTLIDNKP